MMLVLIIGILAVGYLYFAQNAQGETDVFGMKLSAQEISNVASQAGFQGDDLVTAVAVALAESSGDPKAYNPETAAHAPEGQGSFGLWQIYLHAHPEFAGVDLTDPMINAQAAYQIYSDAGSSFRPWSTFTGGAYRAYLQIATDTVSA